MNKDDILKYQFIQKIKKLPYVKVIFLYGSRARGDNLSRSDIDLAIDSPNATENDWVDIMEIIDNADTLLKIDCVRFDKLKENDPLKKRIMKDKVVLYEQGI